MSKSTGKCSNSFTSHQRCPSAWNHRAKGLCKCDYGLGPWEYPSKLTLITPFLKKKKHLSGCENQVNCSMRTWLIALPQEPERSHSPKDCVASWSWTDKKTSPWTSRKWTWYCWHLDFTPWKLCWTTDLYSCKTLNLCCLNHYVCSTAAR